VKFLIIKHVSGVGVTQFTQKPVTIFPDDDGAGIGEVKISPRKLLD